MRTLASPLLFVITLICLPTRAFAAVEDFSMMADGLRVLWALLVVLGVILIIYGFARKRIPFFPGNTKGDIKVLEMRHLMPKKALYLVEVKGQEYLLGVGPETINLIATLDTSQKQTFDSHLKESESEASRII